MNKKSSSSTWRWVIVISLVLAAVAVPQPPAAYGQTGNPYRAILPIIQKTPEFYVPRYSIWWNRYAWIMAGELSNLTNSPVYSVTLQADVYSSDGTYRGTRVIDPIYFAFPATLPGQSNIFNVGFGDLLSGEFNIKFTVPSYSIESPHQYQALTEISRWVTWCDEFDGMRFSGQIRNDSPNSLTNVKVAYYVSARAGGYNYGGKIFTPGEVADYEGAFMYYFSCFENTINQIVVVAQGEVVP